MWETWVQSLGWEDPLKEGMATHASILAQGIPMDRRAWRAKVLGVTKSQTRLINYIYIYIYLLSFSAVNTNITSQVIVTNKNASPISEPSVRELYYPSR